MIIMNKADQICDIKGSTSLFKGLSHGILSYFEHRQNYRLIEGNLKIILYKDRKRAKRS